MRTTPRHFAEQLLLLHAVTQTHLGAPWGNCLEACYATLLGIPLEVVPDPRLDCGLPAAGDDACAADELAARVEALADWLADEHTMVAVSGAGEYPPGVLLRKRGIPLFWIASGPSERGFQHATIWSNGTLIWDPHPSQAGLLSVNRWTVLTPLGPLKDRVLSGWVVPAAAVGRRVRAPRA